MSLAVAFHIIIDAELVTPARLVELMELCSNFQPILEQVGELGLEAFAESFEMQGYGQWAPLARSTQADRDRGGYGGLPPLVRTGALFSALTERGAYGNKFVVTKNSVTIGVWDDEIPYANYLAAGTSKMPARVLIQLMPGDVERGIEMIIDWLGGPSAGIRVYAESAEVD